MTAVYLEHPEVGAGLQATSSKPHDALSSRHQAHGPIFSSKGRELDERGGANTTPMPSGFLSHCVLACSISRNTSRTPTLLCPN